MQEVQNKGREGEIILFDSTPEPRLTERHFTCSGWSNSGFTLNTLIQSILQLSSFPAACSRRAVKMKMDRCHSITFKPATIHRSQNLCTHHLAQCNVTTVRSQKVKDTFHRGGWSVRKTDSKEVRSRLGLRKNLSPSSSTQPAGRNRAMIVPEAHSTLVSEVMSSSGKQQLLYHPASLCLSPCFPPLLHCLTLSVSLHLLY